MCAWRDAQYAPQEGHLEAVFTRPGFTLSSSFGTFPSSFTLGMFSSMMLSGWMGSKPSSATCSRRHSQAAGNIDLEGEPWHRLEVAKDLRVGRE